MSSLGLIEVWRHSDEYDAIVVNSVTPTLTMMCFVCTHQSFPLFPNMRTYICNLQGWNEPPLLQHQYILNILMNLREAIIILLKSLERLLRVDCNFERLQPLSKCSQLTPNSSYVTNICYVHTFDALTPKATWYFASAIRAFYGSTLPLFEKLDCDKPLRWLKCIVHQYHWFSILLYLRLQ